MRKSINEWLNEPINFPNWFGYFLIAILACFLDSFMLTNTFKSVGIQQQFIEARGQIKDLQGSINPINVRLTEIERKLSKPDKKRFILF